MKKQMPKIGIINYGIGNVRSVNAAVLEVGGETILSSNHSELIECDKLILPGVGAFRHGMEELRARGLDQFLKSLAEQNKYILGICLGMQLLGQRSYEFGLTDGLGLIDGEVDLLKNPDGYRCKRLPHVSWTIADRNRTDNYDWLFDGISKTAKFYFIHSYGLNANSANVIAKAKYEETEFCSIAAKKNVIGTQFHPEKSGFNGLRLLSNFVNR